MLAESKINATLDSLASVFDTPDVQIYVSRLFLVICFVMVFHDCNFRLSIRKTG